MAAFIPTAAVLVLKAQNPKQSPHSEDLRFTAAFCSSAAAMPNSEVKKETNALVELVCQTECVPSSSGAATDTKKATKKEIFQ